MKKRFVSLWFRHLTTDWLTLRRPELKALPVILTATERNRIVIKAANALAEREGITAGMTAADAKAIIPDLQVIDAVADQEAMILRKAGEWCIRYSPYVTVDLPDGLLLDISGCTHLWGSERAYLGSLVKTLISKGYDVRGAMADTPGTAWAVARFGRTQPIIESGDQASALFTLPPAALRLEKDTVDRLHKLGFFTIGQLLNIERPALRRRFGDHFLLRMDQALGRVEEPLQPISPIEPYHTRLPFLEPITARPAIEDAIKELLTMLCQRLWREGKGLRMAILKGYRVDGEVISVDIGTGRATAQVAHLYKLFELKIDTIAPALGIELFTLDALKVDDVTAEQEAIWSPEGCNLNDRALAELLDRIANKIGASNIRRYLPQESHWPERSVKLARSLDEKPATVWRTGRRRPSLLLRKPERIDVMYQIPDHPPGMFMYKGKRHNIINADDAERIEPEWWRRKKGRPHRDYYVVEDEQGQRYWVFRSGKHDPEKDSEWFIHGFFA